MAKRSKRKRRGHPGGHNPEAPLVEPRPKADPADIRRFIRGEPDPAQNVPQADGNAGWLNAMLVRCPTMAARPNYHDPRKPLLVPPVKARPTVCQGCGALAGSQEELGCPRMISMREAALLFLPREHLRRDASQIILP